MSRVEKLLTRLFSKPSDFRWTELQKLLSQLEFVEIDGRGSRVKFFHPATETVISLHRPHPRPTLPLGAVDQIIEQLKNMGIEP